MHGSVTLFTPAGAELFASVARLPCSSMCFGGWRLRFQPFVDVRCRLGLPRSPQITFPLHSMRGLRCQFSEEYGLFRKALLKRFLVFDAHAFDGHTRSSC